MLNRRVFVQSVIHLPLLGLLGGCDKPAAPNAVVLKPVPLHNGDECAVCGMLIQRFPGPKGEALGPQGRTLKFCSTRELLTWWLQPENRNQPLTLYVHDMARTGWQHPDDSAFTDARKAWYVIGSDQPGAMGPTLGAFAQQADAQTFSQQHGGNVVAFADLDLDTLSRLMTGMGHGGMP